MKRIQIMVCGVALCGTAGCLSGPTPEYDAEEAYQLQQPVNAMLLTIDPALTQPVSLDDDELPDGLQVVLQPTDAQGEPTKIAGRIMLELHTFRQASADPKGTLIQHWELPLDHARDQETYWNRATRTYEFPLAVTATALPPGPKFVILARYANPWNQFLEDEAVIDVSTMVAQLKSDARAP